LLTEIGVTTIAVALALAVLFAARASPPMAMAPNAKEASMARLNGRTAAMDFSNIFISDSHSATNIAGLLML
jgi:hypothetical protein